jgi:hypothetical protein
MIHLYKKIKSEIVIYSWLWLKECLHNPEIAIPRLISTESYFSSFKVSSEKTAVTSRKSSNDVRSNIFNYFHINSFVVCSNLLNFALIY